MTAYSHSPVLSEPLIVIRSQTIGNSQVILASNFFKRPGICVVLFPLPSQILSRLHRLGCDNLRAKRKLLGDLGEDGFHLLELYFAGDFDDHASGFHRCDVVIHTAWKGLDIISVFEFWLKERYCKVGSFTCVHEKQNIFQIRKNI